VIVGALRRMGFGRCFTALAALVGLAQGCSIEGTRQRNEACLQTRECAAGLVCSPDTSSGDNRLRCTDSLDGTLPVVDVTARPDAASPGVDGASAD
jgi:hypothetical protein